MGYVCCSVCVAVGGVEGRREGIKVKEGGKEEKEAAMANNSSSQQPQMMTSLKSVHSVFVGKMEEGFEHNSSQSRNLLIFSPDFTSKLSLLCILINVIV